MTDHSTEEHIEEMVREVATRSAAVEQLTKEAIIADNKKFRRRNMVLVILTCVLIAGMGYMIYRDIWVNAPGRDKIAEQTKGLQDANSKLDDINAFIEGIDDNQSASREELQAVFDAVFDTREILTCVLQAPDDEAVRACAALADPES